MLDVQYGMAISGVAVLERVQFSVGYWLVALDRSGLDQILRFISRMLNYISRIVDGTVRHPGVRWIWPKKIRHYGESSVLKAALDHMNS